MLVKRDDRLSGLFDPYSDGDDTHSPWPDDDPLADGTEKSAVRPAPYIDGASATPASVGEGEANPSGVETPRFWDVQVPASSTPLPVVRATSEPTQRGLGIPPPPTAEEAAAFARMPSLNSVAPLSLDAFDETTTKTQPKSDAPRPQDDLTENERITVRAPAKGDSVSRTRRHRLYALAALLIVGVLLAMVGLRASRDERAPVVASRPSPQQPPAVAPPVMEEPAVESATGVIESAARAEEEPPSPAVAPRDTTAKVDPVHGAPVRPASRRSHVPTTQRARHEEKKAEPSPVRDPVAHVASGLDTHATPADEDAPAPEHRALSLPPR